MAVLAQLEQNPKIGYNNPANDVHALVVQWIGHKLAELVMLVRFQPRAQMQGAPSGRFAFVLQSDQLIGRELESKGGAVIRQQSDAVSPGAQSRGLATARPRAAGDSNRVLLRFQPTIFTSASTQHG